jgi:hypothetical protein
VVRDGPAVSTAAPTADWPLQVQALERASALYRAEGVRFVEAALELLGQQGWKDVTVADVAAAAGIHPRNAARWLRRVNDDGVLVWLRKVGRGARSRLCLVARNARVCRLPTRARFLALKNLKILNFADPTRGVGDSPERVRRREEAAARVEIVRLVERELIPLLPDADERTATTYARLILRSPRPVEARHVRLLRDRLTGRLPSRRWSTLEHVECPAAYVYEALRMCGQGLGDAEVVRGRRGTAEEARLRRIVFAVYDMDDREEARAYQESAEYLDASRRLDEIKEYQSACAPDPRWAEYDRNDPVTEAELARIREEMAGLSTAEFLARMREGGDDARRRPAEARARAQARPRARARARAGRGGEP